MIRFLCGCTSKLEIPIVGATAQQQQAHLKTFDGVSVDHEGYLQCSLHHQRRMGWRVPLGPKAGGMNDLEWEQWNVWGVKPRPTGIAISPSTVPDLRPHIYEGMMDERAVEAIARSHRPVERGNGSGNAERAHAISAPYCDEATDSSHSSANGLNG